jgi:hypothetical protein
MYLTVLGWPGDIPTAVEVLSRLAHNAVLHARPDTESEADGEMTVRLAVAEDDVLLVDVEDPRPEFPDSTSAIEGEKGSGLRYVRLLRAQVTWSLSEDARTKTVQARLLPDPSAWPSALGHAPAGRRARCPEPMSSIPNGSFPNGSSPHTCRAG